MLDREGRALRDELVRLMAEGADRDWETARFDSLALAVFAYNFHHVPAYGAYCRARGRTPETVASWVEIPAVPAAAFKEVDLLAAEATAEATFLTSGTTRGTERRGVHHVADLSIYRASLRATFEAFVMPDGARMPLLSLGPTVKEGGPASSLAFMIDDVLSHFGTAGSDTFAHGDGIDFQRLDTAVAKAVAAGRPVMLIGTSAAYVHWLHRLTASGVCHVLPTGSRLMDTGGFKGRGRPVAPTELRDAYRDRLGLSPDHCVNEYGMTEMLSQLYDSSLRDRHRGRPAGGRKQGPPWLRSIAVDPETLDPLPAGVSGLLRHVDLANIGSVAAIQTEDLGRVDPAGLVVEGRITGAPPRGCSMAMDLLLEGHA
jgi:hypothetical protein